MFNLVHIPTNSIKNQINRNKFLNLKNLIYKNLLNNKILNWINLQKYLRDQIKSKIIKIIFLNLLRLLTTREVMT